MDEEWRTVWCKVWGQIVRRADSDHLDHKVWIKIFQQLDSEIYAQVGRQVEERVGHELNHKGEY